MVVLIDNIGAIEMLDSKTGQCKTKHIDTRFHWIKQYVDENKVKVNLCKVREQCSQHPNKKSTTKAIQEARKQVGDQHSGRRQTDE